MVMAAMGAPRPTVVQAPGRQDPAASLGGPSAPSSRAGAAPAAAAAGPSTAAATEAPAEAPELPAPPPPRRHPEARPAERQHPRAPEVRPDPDRGARAPGPLAAPNRAPAGRAAVTVRPVPPEALTSRVQRPVRRGVPWTALALLAAALLLAVCVLMAVASAIPAHRRAVAPALPAPTQVAPAPTAQVAPAPAVSPPTFGDVPVTTPIVAVPAAPGAPAAPSPAGTAPVTALSDLPPASAGDVLAVTLDVSGCAAGAACTISVEVMVQPSPSRRSVSWTLSSIDLCTGRAVPLAASSVPAQAGWNHVIGLSTVTLPASSAQVLVAITDSPARAASSLAAVGSSHCP
jgi:hypothetical protein